MALTAKERREMYRKELAKRHQESYASRNDSGRFRSIYTPDKISGVRFWNPSTDKSHAMYIVAYVTGENHPYLPPMKSAFVLNVFIHRGVGINEDSYICLNKTFTRKNLGCPICEYQHELRETGESTDDVIRSLNASKRSIYNIVVTSDANEKAKGVQVFDIPQWSFTLPLEDLANKKKEGGQYLYAHPDFGKIISFSKKGTKRDTKYTAFEFEDRPEIPDAILESAFCLENLLHVPTYQEVHDAFFQNKEEETVSEEGSAKEEAPMRKEEETVSEEGSAKEEAPMRKEEEPPSVSVDSAGTGHYKLTPRKQKTTTTKFAECPHGAAFGADFNEYEECRECEAREDCKIKKDELSKPKEEVAAPDRKKLLRRKA